MDIKDEILELLNIININFQGNYKEGLLSTVTISDTIYINSYWGSKNPIIFYDHVPAGKTTNLINQLKWLENKIDLNELKLKLEEHLISLI
ncbi:MAG: hypothetical protein H7836_04830 [Magnetococcus sp. YQC-3]